MLSSGDPLLGDPEDPWMQIITFIQVRDVQQQTFLLSFLINTGHSTRVWYHKTARDVTLACYTISDRS